MSSIHLYQSNLIHSMLVLFNIFSTSIDDKLTIVWIYLCLPTACPIPVLLIFYILLSHPKVTLNVVHIGL